MDEYKSTSDVESQVNDVLSGEEPGGGSEHYLVACDEFGDIDDEQDAAGTKPKSRRRHSSTINKIKREIKRQEHTSNHLESIKVVDSYVSSDDAANSSTSANVSESENENLENSGKVCIMIGLVGLDCYSALGDLAHTCYSLQGRV